MYQRRHAVCLCAALFKPTPVTTDNTHIYYIYIFISFLTMKVFACILFSVCYAECLHLYLVPDYKKHFTTGIKIYTCLCGEVKEWKNVNFFLFIKASMSHHKSVSFAVNRAETVSEVSVQRLVPPLVTVCFFCSQVFLCVLQPSGQLHDENTQGEHGRIDL